MNVLTNKEIAKVFALHLGQQMIDFDMERFILRGVSVTPTDTLYIHAVPKFDSAYYNQKLLLTPLDQISDEDAIEVARLAGYSRTLKDMVLIGKDVIKGLSGKSHEYKYIHSWFIFQYLISKGYAVPIFISPNHPLNGQTPIELGIAINKLKQPETDI